MRAATLLFLISATAGFVAASPIAHDEYYDHKYVAPKKDKYYEETKKYVAPKKETKYYEEPKKETKYYEEPKKETKYYEETKKYVAPKKETKYYEEPEKYY